MNKMAALAGAAALALIPATAGAQAQEATAAASTKVDPRAVVADVKRIINENYVRPEMRPQLAAALDKGLAAGRYNVSDTGVLSERINADLTAVGGLRRCSNRERPTDGPRRPRDRDVDPGEVERRPRVHHVIAPGHSTVLHDEFANGDLHGRRLVLARRGGHGAIGAGSK